VCHPRCDVSDSKCNMCMFVEVLEYVKYLIAYTVTDCQHDSKRLDLYL
jgi:hypothetical protein